MKWGACPALVCVYVLYHIDRQIDPLLPNIGATGREGALTHRLARCAFFALLVMLFSLLPAASIQAPSDSVWLVDKLRTVVVGTIFTIGLTMALVSEFCLVKPADAKRESDDKDVRSLIRQP